MHAVEFENTIVSLKEKKIVQAMLRRIKLTAIFLVVVLVGYFGIRLFGGLASVPSEFTEARLQGAVIAGNIVNLSNETSKALERVSDLARAQEYEEAVGVAGELIVKSRRIRDEAVRLSAETEKMTRALSEIGSFEARQAALEAISNHLALLSRLINYSASLGRLMETLQARFSGIPAPYRVSQIISDINAEVTAINNFNAQAVQALERFDAITK